MEIASSFELDLPPDQAYELLLDLDRVAPCMPGASLGAALDSGARELSVTVRLGPMKFVYKGTVEIAERDPAARRAVLVGAANEARGQGDAHATITMTVAGEGAGSMVRSEADIQLRGRAAQTGRGIVEDVSKRMIDEMATCLSAQVEAAKEQAQATTGTGAEGAETGVQPAPGSAAAAGAGAGAGNPPPPQTKPIRAGSLALKVLWARVRRLFRRDR